MGTPPELPCNHLQHLGIPYTVGHQVVRHALYRHPTANHAGKVPNNGFQQSGDRDLRLSGLLSLWLCWSSMSSTITLS